MSGASKEAWQLAFQSAPIVLTGGLAAQIPGGYLPLLALTEGINFLSGAVTGTIPNSQNDFFAQFEPLPGSNLVANQLGQYPFANQAVAANAIIKQPLTVSMLMKAPSRDPASYWFKMAKFSALKATLDKHSDLGGTYLVLTPAYPFENAILLGVTDVTSGEGKQPQIEWQWDFQVPLITQQAAASAFNALMSRLDGGAKITSPSWSGVAQAVGYPLQAAAASFSGIAGAATGITSYVSGAL